jgi:hypothetical protein
MCSLCPLGLHPARSWQIDSSGYPNSALEQRLHACGARAAATRLAKLTA